MGFLRDTFGLGRDPENIPRDPSAWPFLVDGTNMSLWWSQIPEFWLEEFGGVLPLTPATAEKVWVCNRCMQLNAQQISSMPLRFHSTAPGGGYEPAWVSNPDPNWFPNGVSDAIFAVTRLLYAYGFAVLLVTQRYSNGFPQNWTVADSAFVEIGYDRGRRTYKYGDDFLDPRDVVQIDRNPGNALHGSSAISAYASQVWGLLGGSELSRSVMSNGVPSAVLKSQRKLTKEQAESLQAQWVSRVSSRGGAPPILPPELDFETLSMSPEDLLLVDGLEFNARVIASAYGIPAVLLNLVLSGGLTYANPALLGEQWWRFELRPTAKRIADALTAQMLPRGNWVVFDAADTFAEITGDSEEDDPQLSQVAGASPVDQPGVIPIRASEVV
jgi:HK97 family phage portal protein